MLSRENTVMDLLWCYRITLIYSLDKLRAVRPQFLSPTSGHSALYNIHTATSIAPRLHGLSPFVYLPYLAYHFSHLERAVSALSHHMPRTPWLTSSVIVTPPTRVAPLRHRARDTISFSPCTLLTEWDRAPQSIVTLSVYSIVHYLLLPRRRALL